MHFRSSRLARVPTQVRSAEILNLLQLTTTKISFPHEQLQLSQQHFFKKISSSGRLSRVPTWPGYSQAVQTEIFNLLQLATTKMSFPPK